MPPTSPTSDNTTDSHSPRALSPDDALPPVEAPNVGFILKLFVVPGVIVGCLVAVWVMVQWLAHMGEADPMSYVNAIKRNNEARWQGAVNLANALNNERGANYQALKHDHKVVKELADILTSELNSQEKVADENAVTFRMYLCMALGAFEVDDGLPALLQAADTQRDEKELIVRRSALQSLALLSENMRKADPTHPLQSEQLTAALLKAAGDDDPLVRESAAYAIGVIGGEELLPRLRAMLNDGYPNARYNAATGLARHGDIAATEVLLEMIDPNEQAGVQIEEDTQARPFKRALIETNGLRAIKTLLAANPKIDASIFDAQIKKLLESKTNLPGNVRAEAESVQRIIGKGKS